MEDKPGMYPSELDELRKTERRDAVRQDIKQKKNCPTSAEWKHLFEKEVHPATGGHLY